MTDTSPLPPLSRETFIVRVWRTADPAQPEWRVQVQNVRTGEVTHLRDAAGLEGYLHGQLPPAPVGGTLK